MCHNGREMAESTSVSTTIGQGGRIVIPAAFRKALGLRKGSTVVLSLQIGDLRITTREQALRRIQDHVRRLVPPGVSLVDELIRERREEAKRE
jgi:AbrB family looped-hinge helix DNA binding protein